MTQILPSFGQELFSYNYDDQRARQRHNFFAKRPDNSLQTEGLGAVAILFTLFAVAKGKAGKAKNIVKGAAKKGQELFKNKTISSFLKEAKGLSRKQRTKAAEGMNEFISKAKVDDVDELKKVHDELMNLGDKDYKRIKAENLRKSIREKLEELGHPIESKIGPKTKQTKVKTKKVKTETTSSEKPSEAAKNTNHEATANTKKNAASTTKTKWYRIDKKIKDRIDAYQCGITQKKLQAQINKENAEASKNIKEMGEKISEEISKKSQLALPPSSGEVVVTSSAVTKGAGAKQKYPNEIKIIDKTKEEIADEVLKKKALKQAKAANGETKNIKDVIEKNLGIGKTTKETEILRAENTFNKALNEATGNTVEQKLINEVSDKANKPQLALPPSSGKTYTSKSAVTKINNVNKKNGTIKETPIKVLESSGKAIPMAQSANQKLTQKEAQDTIEFLTKMRGGKTAQKLNNRELNQVQEKVNSLLDKAGPDDLKTLETIRNKVRALKIHKNKSKNPKEELITKINNKRKELKKAEKLKQEALQKDQDLLNSQKSSKAKSQKLTESIRQQTLKNEISKEIERKGLVNYIKSLNKEGYAGLLPDDAASQKTLANLIKKHSKNLSESELKDLGAALKEQKAIKLSDEILEDTTKKLGFRRTQLERVENFTPKSSKKPKDTEVSPQPKKTKPVNTNQNKHEYTKTSLNNELKKSLNKHMEKKGLTLKNPDKAFEVIEDDINKIISKALTQKVKKQKKTIEQGVKKLYRKLNKQDRKAIWKNFKKNVAEKESFDLVQGLAEEVRFSYFCKEGATKTTKTVAKATETSIIEGSKLYIASQLGILAEPMLAKSLLDTAETAARYTLGIATAGIRSLAKKENNLNYFSGIIFGNPANIITNGLGAAAAGIIPTIGIVIPKLFSKSEGLLGGLIKKNNLNELRKNYTGTIFSKLSD